MKRLKIKILCLAFAGLAPAVVSTQGLRVDESRHNALPRQPLYSDGGKAEAEELAGIRKIDLKPYCPKPRSQGQVASCTGWATGYAALTIANAAAREWGSPKTVADSAFSALFLYNQVRENFEDCTEGSYIDQALKLLQEKGNLTAAEFDADASDCKKLPTNAEMAVAQQYRIKDWVALFASNDPARIKIDKTKLSLAAKKPVIIAMQLRNNFIGLGRDNRYWLPMLGDTTELYYHAMTVVGFDDGKGAFQVMNSWGEGWGNEGFFWIRYDDYARQTKYAYDLTVQAVKKTLLSPKPKPKPNVEPAKTLFGGLTLRYPVSVKDGVFQFKNAGLTYKNGVYELAGPENSWPIGKLYQMLAGNVMAGAYLYAFSFDAAREIRVHWPRDGQLDEKFEGLNESAVITSTRVSLVIPTEKTALKLEKKGDEYLCVLFSKDPLRDFNNVLQQIKGYDSKIQLPERVGNALGKRLIPVQELRFSPDAPEFSTTAATGSVAALFLKIPVR